MSVTTGTDSEAARLVGADRVLAVLLELGEHPTGIGLEDLAQRLNSSKSTVHRALTALRRARLAHQLHRGVYVLGDEVFRLAFRNYADRPESVLVRPILESLAEEFGETAHYAVLDGKEIVYRAKVDPHRGAVRLTSVVGGRNPAYRTAVGKLLLSERVTSLDELVDWLGPDKLERRTANTICDAGDLWAELVLTRQRGYAVDDQENEVGINCVAVPARPAGDLPDTGAISVSGLTFRTSLAALVEAVPRITQTVVDGVTRQN